MLSITSAFNLVFSHPNGKFPSPPVPLNSRKVLSQLRSGKVFSIKSLKEKKHFGVKKNVTTVRTHHKDLNTEHRYCSCICAQNKVIILIPIIIIIGLLECTKQHYFPPTAFKIS